MKNRAFSHSCQKVSSPHPALLPDRKVQFSCMVDVRKTAVFVLPLQKVYFEETLNVKAKMSFDKTKICKIKAVSINYTKFATKYFYFTEAYFY
jgi:hypothetical protein